MIVWYSINLISVILTIFSAGGKNTMLLEALLKKNIHANLLKLIQYYFIYKTISINLILFSYIFKKYRFYSKILILFVDQYFRSIFLAVQLSVRYWFYSQPQIHEESIDLVFTNSFPHVLSGQSVTPITLSFQAMKNGGLNIEKN